MAFTYQVVCDCGYHSNTIPYGMTSRSPFEFVVPVYVPKQSELLECVFSEREFGLDGEALVAWIEANGGDVVTERFGEDAIACGINTVDFQTLLCPKCGQSNARFNCVGF